MANTSKLNERHTSVDEVFDYLHNEIATLGLRPGDKISEAEMATRFGISRQPVRDAFSRLANLDLLLIRPQRATVVKRFSMREIEKSRFVRAAVESEILRRAAQKCDEDGAAKLDAAIQLQERAILEHDVDGFDTLDYEFHETLCTIAGAEFAFDVIMKEKAKVDRLCRLELSKEQRMPKLIADHKGIAEAVKTHDGDRAVEIGALHLSRLDETIERITTTNASYFEAFEG